MRTMNEQDKRLSPRFAISQAIEMSYGHENFFWARGLDLSLGGMRFETSANLDSLAQIYMNLVVKMKVGDFPVIVEGVVVRQRKLEDGKWEIGMKFSSFEPGSQDNLEAYLKEAEKTEA
jgi:c-di-GMP-binding flagellar brake protein YcgR